MPLSLGALLAWHLALLSLCSIVAVVVAAVVAVVAEVVAVVVTVAAPRKTNNPKPIFLKILKIKALNLNLHLNNQSLITIYFIKKMRRNQMI